MRCAVALLAAGLALASPAPAFADWTGRGEVAGEARAFTPDDNALTTDYGLGMAARVEVGNTHRPFQEKFRAFGRVDTVDPQRSLAFIEEAWLQYRKDGWRLRVGADILNWTATEAFHPADVVNSRNLDSDFESLEKIGEPMVVVSRDIRNADLTAIVMPMYIKPQLASPKSRLNFFQGSPVRPSILRLGPDGRKTDSRWFGPQGALLYEQTIRSADLALHAIYHLDRGQPFVFAAPGSTITAVFQTKVQVGGTWQQAVGPVLLKGEAAWRHFFEADTAVTGLPPLDDRDHTQIALGVEYGLTLDSGVDHRFIVEGQAVFAESGLQRRAATIFQRDILVAYRLAMNDVKARELFVSAIFDLEDAGELMANASYSQRLSDTWGISTSIRLIEAPAPAPGMPPQGLQALRKADQIRLKLTRYF